MFIKIQYLNAVFILSGCGGGPVARVSEIGVVDTLPKDTLANKAVNSFWLVEKEDYETGKVIMIERPVDVELLDNLFNTNESEQSDNEKSDNGKNTVSTNGCEDESENNASVMMTYEYYYDCGKLSKNKIENAIKILKYEYAQRDGLGYEGGYDLKNLTNKCPIIKDLNRIMKRVRSPNAYFFKMMEKINSLAPAEEKGNYLETASVRLLS